jgi:hypothetical protein
MSPTFFHGPFKGPFKSTQEQQADPSADYRLRSQQTGWLVVSTHEPRELRLPPSRSLLIRVRATLRSMRATRFARATVKATACSVSQHRQSRELAIAMIFLACRLDVTRELTCSDPPPEHRRRTCDGRFPWADVACDGWTRGPGGDSRVVLATQESAGPSVSLEQVQGRGGVGVGVGPRRVQGLPAVPFGHVDARKFQLRWTVPRPIARPPALTIA